jgi:hypothetical protein
MRITIFILFTIVAFSVFSQTGDVKIIKDDRIESLVRQKSVIIPPATSPQINGYRIQLIFDSNKQLVDDARSKVVSSNQHLDTYILYNAPHFVLKVGDFRSKQEAEKVKSSLVRDFPTCFVVKEMVNLPRID